MWEHKSRRGKNVLFILNWGTPGLNSLLNTVAELSCKTKESVEHDYIFTLCTKGGI